jgi:hypothetical protein
VLRTDPPPCISRSGVIISPQSCFPPPFFFDFRILVLPVFMLSFRHGPDLANRPAAAAISSAFGIPTSVQDDRTCWPARSCRDESQGPLSNRRMAQQKRSTPPARSKHDRHGSAEGSLHRRIRRTDRREIRRHTDESAAGSRSPRILTRRNKSCHAPASQTLAARITAAGLIYDVASVVKHPS